MSGYMASPILAPELEPMLWQNMLDRINDSGCRPIVRLAAKNIVVFLSKDEVFAEPELFLTDNGLQLIWNCNGVNIIVTVTGTTGISAFIKFSNDDTCYFSFGLNDEEELEKLKQIIKESCQ